MRLTLPRSGRNPVVLAKQMATLDRLSDGRFILGTGVGWAKKEFEALEIKDEKLNEKLPIRDSFSEFLNQISMQTESLKFDVVAINRLKEVNDDELKVLRVPIMLDLVTDYKTLGDYLNALEGIDIALNIRQLMITKDKKNLPRNQLRVNLKMETYISLVE